MLISFSVILTIVLMVWIGIKASDPPKSEAQAEYATTNAKAPAQSWLSIIGMCCLMVFSVIVIGLYGLIEFAEIQRAKQKQTWQPITAELVDIKDYQSPSSRGGGYYCLVVTYQYELRGLHKGKWHKCHRSPEAAQYTKNTFNTIRQFAVYVDPNHPEKSDMHPRKPQVIGYVLVAIIAVSFASLLCLLLYQLIKSVIKKAIQWIGE